MRRIDTDEEGGGEKCAQVERTAAKERACSAVTLATRLPAAKHLPAVTHLSQSPCRVEDVQGCLRHGILPEGPRREEEKRGAREGREAARNAMKALAADRRGLSV